MSDNTTIVRFPILGILGLIFITLKLTGTITWSWWRVTAPFWIPFAFILCAFIVLLPFVLLAKRKIR